MKSTYFLGYIKIKAAQEFSVRLLKIITDYSIPCTELALKDDFIQLKLSFFSFPRFKKLCKEYNIEYEISEQKGISAKLKKYLPRFGIPAGIAASCLIIHLLDSTVLSINVMNAAPEARTEVLSILKAEDVDIMSRFSDLDLNKLEREVQSQSKLVSWVGMRKNGCSLIIETLPKIQIPQNSKQRMPCNLISSESGTVKEVFVLDGLLTAPVGTQVNKGDLLISGTDYDEEGKTVYAIAQGSIKGEFTREITFSQPFVQKQAVDCTQNVKKNYLKLFDAEIPLFFKSAENVSYYTLKKHDLKILGNKLPIGIYSYDCKTYEYEDVPVSENQAKLILQEQIELYKQDFLDDYDILDCKIDYKKDNKQLTASVSFKLYGEMAVKDEFFPSPQLPEPPQESEVK